MTFAALQTPCLLTMFPIEPKIGRKDPLVLQITSPKQLSWALYVGLDHTIKSER